MPLQAGGRPMPMQAPMQAPMPPRAGAPVPPRMPQAARGAPGYKANQEVKPAAGAGLTAAQLVNAEPQEQKQMLGEAYVPFSLPFSSRRLTISFVARI